MPEKTFELNKSQGILWLFIIIICFTIAKIPILHTPYFWDELGVYAPAALMMKDHNSISLLPASLEPLYSRGHPLLATATYATAYKYFGDTVATGHWVTIIMSLLTIVAIYFFAARLSDVKTAVLTSVMLCIQPLFFANAGLVLPEIMLTMLVIPCISAIVYERWWIYGIMGSLAMMTKESAIILPATAFIFIFLYRNKYNQQGIARFIKLILASLIPLFVFVIFLIIQKKQNGWYFFPEHVGYIKYRPTYVADAIIKTVKDLFILQGRWLLSIPLLGGLFIKNKILKTPLEKRMYTVLWIFIILGIISASLNYYLVRYTVFILPIIMFLSSFSFFKIIGWYGKLPPMFTTMAFTICILLAGIYSMDPKKFSDTSDMSYLHIVQCEQDCISWVEKQPWRDSLIRANFPVEQGIKDTRNGYLSGKPLNSTGNWDVATKYFLYFKFVDATLPGFQHYKIIKQFDNYGAQILVISFEP